MNTVVKDGTKEQISETPYKYRECRWERRWECTHSQTASYHAILMSLLPFVRPIVVEKQLCARSTRWFMIFCTIKLGCA